MDKQKERTWSSQVEMKSEESNMTMLPEQKIERTESNKEDNNIFHVEWIWKRPWKEGLNGVVKN